MLFSVELSKLDVDNLCLEYIRKKFQIDRKTKLTLTTDSLGNATIKSNSEIAERGIFDSFDGDAY